jgi:hypothetical protein
MVLLVTIVVGMEECPEEKTDLGVNQSQGTQQRNEVRALQTIGTPESSYACKPAISELSNYCANKLCTTKSQAKVKRILIGTVRECFRHTDGDDKEI